MVTEPFSRLVSLMSFRVNGEKRFVKEELRLPPDRPAEAQYKNICMSIMEIIMLNRRVVDVSHGSMRSHHLAQDSCKNSYFDVNVQFHGMPRLQLLPREDHLYSEREYAGYCTLGPARRGQHPYYVGIQAVQIPMGSGLPMLVDCCAAAIILLSLLSMAVVVAALTC